MTGCCLFFKSAARHQVQQSIKKLMSSSMPYSLVLAMVVLNTFIMLGLPTRDSFPFSSSSAVASRMAATVASGLTMMYSFSRSSRVSPPCLGSKKSV